MPDNVLGLTSNAWVAIASIVNALTVIFLTFITAWYARQAKRQADSTDAQVRELKVQYLHRWVEDSMRELSAMHLICDGGDSDLAAIARERCYELTALLEQGRTFFSNSSRGWRRRILDWLKLAFELCQALPSIENRTEVQALLGKLVKDFRSDATDALELWNTHGTAKDFNQRLISSSFMDDSQNHPDIREVKQFLSSRVSVALSTDSRNV
jgi:hypothetical protein